LSLDGIGVEDEHIQQADRQGYGQAADSTHKNIARERRVSTSSRSIASSFGFNAAVNARVKNSAFTAS